MKKWVLASALITSLTGWTTAAHADFPKFIADLKIAAEQKDLEKIESIFSEDYIRADKFMFQTPSTPLHEVLQTKVEWFLNDRAIDEDILSYTNETLKVVNDIYTEHKDVHTWVRTANHKGGETFDVDIEFVKHGETYTLRPHFTHPTAAQLDNLEKMENIYALYYAMENVAHYEIHTNGITYDLTNPDLTTLPLRDVRSGENDIKFTFEKEDETLPISFAATIVFTPRGSKTIYTEPENTINLHAEALSIDRWGDLSPTTEKVIALEGTEITMPVTLK